MMRVTRKIRYAVRDAATKERLSYRYPTYREARQLAREMAARNGQALEVYRTSQSVVTGQ